MLVHSHAPFRQLETIEREISTVTPPQRRLAESRMSDETVLHRRKLLQQIGIQNPEQAVLLLQLSETLHV